MAGTIRFTWLRPGGWGRLGVVCSMALLFATPMLWAVGAFGEGDDAIRHATVFLFSGLWFGAGVGYGIGWAVRGFIVRTRDHDEDEDGGAGSRPMGRPTGAPGRPGH